MKKCILTALALGMTVPAVAADDFDWSRATVYFVITDRFSNGDTTNDNNYGRINDYGSERMNLSLIHI